MQTIQGKGISQGVIKGPLYFFHRADTAVIQSRNHNIDREKQRLREAQEKSVCQLKELADQCRAEKNIETAHLFDIHTMLIEDTEYVDRILFLLDRESCSAEYAVWHAGELFAGMLSGMKDPYMQERAEDIRDVSRRLRNNLLGVSEGGIDSEEPVILAADDLSPSEVVRLDRNKLLGIVTRGGSSGSHTAILARSMRIPAICGVGEELLEAYSGREVYIDGESGTVYLDPDESTLLLLTQKQEDQRRQQELLLQMKGQEDVTPDGRRIRIACNIGDPKDIEAVAANDGREIGLFRSEFLYLAASDFPSEEEQFEAYRTVAEAMHGERVVIRTLDIGVDKQVDYFQMRKEENPALGVRGIRICLNRPEIFLPQLRAIYRASAYGKVAILLPMITSVWEVAECRRLCEQIMRDFDAEGIPYDPSTEIGIMIETPAAVLIAEELAGMVDFFSVGTNDLTQYTLACDRQCSDMEKFFDPCHPSLLRAMKMAADAAHANGIWIGVCGELAADLELLPTFLEMGIDELSVTPNEVLSLRAAVRGMPQKAI